MGPCGYTLHLQDKGPVVVKNPLKHSKPPKALNSLLKTQHPKTSKALKPQFFYLKLKTPQFLYLKLKTLKPLNL